MPAGNQTSRMERYWQTDKLLVPTKSFGGLISQGMASNTVVFSDISDDERLQVMIPNVDLKTVVGDTIQQTLVAVKFTGTAKASLEVQQIDLVYHPMYVFEFRRQVPGMPEPMLRVEQMDAVTGQWFECSPKGAITSKIPWDEILLFTADTVSEILLSFAPPGVKVAVTIAKKSIEHFGSDDG